MQSLELMFGGLAIAAEHPNKMKFKGVLVRLNEPSDKPPNGSRGHRIMVPGDVAQRRLQTIVGMGLNYSPSLDSHAQRRKVGVINNAWIDGNNMWVEGTVWKHDFPEAERDLKQDNLGMSMEIGDVNVEDVDAQVWKLTDFKFLGATILYKNAAAYHNTRAIAAAKERSNMSKVASKTKKPEAAPQLTAQQVATVAAQAAKAAVRPFADILDKQTELLAGINARQEALELEVITRGKVDAAKEDDDDDDEEEDEEANAEMVPDMKVTKAASEDDEDAAHAKDEEDGEDEENDDDEDDLASAIDKGSLTEMGPDTADPGDDEPGHFSEKATNKGSKTTTEDKVGSNISKGVTGAAYKVLKNKFKEVVAELHAMRADNAKLRKQLTKINGQVIKASAEIGRRSVAYPAEVAGLLRKNGIDPVQLQASGEKKTVEEVDGMLATMPGLSPLDRIALKTKMVEHGIMDEGRVDRGYQR